MTENRKTPKLRFKGFTDAWEQRKLSEVLSSYTDPVEIPRTGYERLGIRSHAKGTFHNFVPAGHELQTAQMHRVAADKFIVNITFGWEHAVAVTDENDAGKLVSHRFPQFSLSEELDPKFLKFIILDEDFRHHLWLASPGGAGRNRVLNINEMLQYEIMIPNVPEQRKIARMLIDLDNLITLHQRKLDRLKNIKKSMLDKMFPKDGEVVPEIRFKGFTDAWEQRKLGDLAEIRRGLTYKPGDVKASGIRVLRSSNINEEYFEIYEDDVFVDEVAINIPYVKKGDIIITSANGSSRLVGKHAIIKNIQDNSMVHGGFMLVASADEPEFLNSSMSSPWYTKFINIYVAGGNGAIGNLSKNDLDNQEILVPSIAEQQKIGTYFRTIDNLITLHQRKLDKLKNIKKSMLDNMFV